MSISTPFCPVCLEQMIHRIYDQASPIQGAIQRTGSTLGAPVAIGDRLRTRWFVDGKMVQDTPSYLPLTLDTPPDGKRKVHLVAMEEGAPVRHDRCDLVFVKAAQY